MKRRWLQVLVLCGMGTLGWESVTTASRVLVGSVDLVTLFLVLLIFARHLATHRSSGSARARLSEAAGVLFRPMLTVALLWSAVHLLAAQPFYAAIRTEMGWWAVHLSDTLRAVLLVSAAAVVRWPAGLRGWVGGSVLSVLVGLGITALTADLAWQRMAGDLLAYTADAPAWIALLSVSIGLAAGTFWALNAPHVRRRADRGWLDDSSRDAVVLTLPAGGARRFGLAGWRIGLGLLVVVISSMFGVLGDVLVAPAVGVGAFLWSMGELLRLGVALGIRTEVRLTPYGAQVGRPGRRSHHRIEARDLQLQVVNDSHGAMLVVGPGAVVASEIDSELLELWLEDVRQQLCQDTDADAAAARASLRSVATLSQGRSIEALGWLEPSRRFGTLAAMVPPGVVVVVTAVSLGVFVDETVVVPLIGAAVVLVSELLRVLWMSQSSADQARARTQLDRQRQQPVPHPAAVSSQEGVEQLPRPGVPLPLGQVQWGRNGDK